MTWAGSPRDIKVPRAGSPWDIKVPRAACPGDIKVPRAACPGDINVPRAVSPRDIKVPRADCPGDINALIRINFGFCHKYCTADVVKCLQAVLEHQNNGQDRNLPFLQSLDILARSQCEKLEQSWR